MMFVYDYCPFEMETVAKPCFYLEENEKALRDYCLGIISGALRYAYAAAVGEACRTGPHKSNIVPTLLSGVQQMLHDQ